MSAFEQPKITSLTINGTTATVYVKGVDQDASTGLAVSTDLTSASWTLADASGDYTLSKDGISFGQSADTRHIEVVAGSNIQMNTAPTDFHPQMWQIDAYLPDGSVVHKQGGGSYFLMEGLPTGTIFAELMLGPNPSNTATLGTPQTETLAYIVNNTQTETELFYIDTSGSQDGSSFGLLLNTSGTPVTRTQIETGAIDVNAVQVAPVDYQVPASMVNWTYDAPTSTTTFDSLGLLSSAGTSSPGDTDQPSSQPDPIGPDGTWTDPTTLYTGQLGSLVEGSGPNDMLDLTSPTVPYDLDAGFGSWDLSEGNYDADVGIIFYGGDQAGNYTEFKGIEGYKVSGLSTDGEVIRFNALDDINETIEIGGGYGLKINLGEGELSDADVVVFTGGAVSIDLSSEDQYGYVSYTYTDTSGGGSIRGADIVIGSAYSDSSDSITGSDGRDVLVGLAGSDFLSGGKGDDFIIGGAGSDVIDGGAGDDIIVDLDSDTLTGGEGRDVFVVNGELGNGFATITDLDVSEDGLSFKGLDTDKYADRIAFSFNAATVATALSSAAGLDLTGKSDPLTDADYFKLARALDLDVTENTAAVVSTDPAYMLTVSYTDDYGTTTLGKVGFSVSDRPADKPVFNEAEHVYKATLLEAHDVGAQLTQALLDQISYYANVGTDIPAEESITLFVGVERADKNAVFGDGDPVLVAYRENDIEISTKFRPSNADEVMLGSRAGDVYALSSQVFVDESTGLPQEGSQDFGSDTIVERGGADDVLSLELSLDDLLVGDLDLARTERGREGDDRSLAVSYAQANGDGTLNSVDLTIYKQFVDYDSSFRVEGIELVDPNGGYETLSLGETISDANIAVDGSTDAILVGRVNKADTFTVRDADTGTNGTADLYLVDFDASADSLDFSAYDSVTGDDLAGYADGFAEITATRADGTTVDYDVYIVGTYTPPLDEELQQGV